MSEAKLYPVQQEWAERAYIDADKYREMYRRSVEDPDGFWAEQAKRIDWHEALHQGEEHQLTNIRTSPSNGSRTARSTSRPTASTGI